MDSFLYPTLLSSILRAHSWKVSLTSPSLAHPTRHSEPLICLLPRLRLFHNNLPFPTHRTLLRHMHTYLPLFRSLRSVIQMKFCSRYSFYQSPIIVFPTIQTQLRFRFTFPPKRNINLFISKSNQSSEPYQINSESFETSSATHSRIFRHYLLTLRNSLRQAGTLKNERTSSTKSTPDFFCQQSGTYFTTL